MSKVEMEILKEKGVEFEEKKDGIILTGVPTEWEGTFEIPNGVTEIGVGAFESCMLLQKIVIPESITKIGLNAFFMCKGLKEINIPNSVTKIDAFAFSGCESLKKINIPNSVDEFGTGAFYNCKSLQEIVIPDNFIDIGGSTFFGCSNLMVVSLPKCIVKIGYHCFDGCDSLKTIYTQDKNFKENLNESKDEPWFKLLKYKKAEKNYVPKTLLNAVKVNNKKSLCGRAKNSDDECKN